MKSIERAIVINLNIFILVCYFDSLLVLSVFVSFLGTGLINFAEKEWWG